MQITSTYKTYNELYIIFLVLLNTVRTVSSVIDMVQNKWVGSSGDENIQFLHKGSS